MPNELLAVLISGFCSIVGAWFGVRAGNKLIEHRINELEKKMDKHNNVIHRMYIVEEQVKVANHRIADLEGSKK